MMQPTVKVWKYIFEIRYPASAYFFDRRGFLIEQFKGEPFTHWRMQRNRVDLYDAARFEQKSVSVFAGFKNAGAMAEDPPSYTYFRDHLQRWLRLIIPEIKCSKIERIGFRTINLAQISNSSFEQLFKSFTSSYLKVGKELWELETASAKDVGVIVDLVIGKDKMHMVTGPMEQVQASEYFECVEVRDKLPPLSIFIDLDYRSENPSFEESRLLQAIMRFVNDAKSRTESHLQEFLKIFRQQEG